MWDLCRRLGALSGLLVALISPPARAQDEPAVARLYLDSNTVLAARVLRRAGHIQGVVTADAYELTVLAVYRDDLRLVRSNDTIILLKPQPAIPPREPVSGDDRSNARFAAGQLLLLFGFRDTVFGVYAPARADSVMPLQRLADADTTLREIESYAGARSPKPDDLIPKLLGKHILRAHGIDTYKRIAVQCPVHLEHAASLGYPPGYVCSP
jgi:hypothetical protein